MISQIDTQLQKKAILYLSAKDPVFSKLLNKIEPPIWSLNSNYFIALVETVISQQLSIKASETIFGRFKALTDDSELTAEAVIKMEPQRIRDSGISWQKINYIKNIAEYTLTSDKVFERFMQMPDEEIIAELTKIKGIGRWTAEMFLIFTMGRPDIFSYGDFGLKKAIKKLYGLKDEPNKLQLEQITGNWKPYRSIACRYLWKSLDLS